MICSTSFDAFLCPFLILDTVVALSIVLYLHCLGASYLVFRPATVNADLKKPVSLKCQSDETIDIYFKDQKILSSAKYTVIQRPNIDLEVTIASVEVGDIGSYTCRSSASTPSAPVTVALQLKRKSFNLCFVLYFQHATSIKNFSIK